LTAVSHRTVVFVNVNGLGFVSGSRLGPPSRLPGLSRPLKVKKVDVTVSSLRRGAGMTGFPQTQEIPRTHSGSNHSLIRCHGLDIAEPEGGRRRGKHTAWRLHNSIITDDRPRPSFAPCESLVYQRRSQVSLAAPSIRNESAAAGGLPACDRYTETTTTANQAWQG
jgi:hypothetical protein